MTARSGLAAQLRHEQLQAGDPKHDDVECWCCCSTGCARAAYPWPSPFRLAFVALFAVPLVAAEAIGAGISLLGALGTGLSCAVIVLLAEAGSDGWERLCQLYRERRTPDRWEVILVGKESGAVTSLSFLRYRTRRDAARQARRMNRSRKAEALTEYRVREFDAQASKEDER